MTHRTVDRRVGWQTFLSALLLACAWGIVLLTVENRRLAMRVSEVTRKVLLPYEGLMLPTARVATVDGDTLTVGEESGGGRQVLLVFTTTCPYCRASIPWFKAIQDSLQRSIASGEAKVIGVSLDSLKPTAAYRDKYDLTFPIALFARKLPVVYRTVQVPIVIVLDSVGQVTYRRLGVLGPEAVDSIVQVARGPLSRHKLAGVQFSQSLLSTTK